SPASLVPQDARVDHARDPHANVPTPHPDAGRVGVAPPPQASRPEQQRRALPAMGLRRAFGRQALLLCLAELLGCGPTGPLLAEALLQRVLPVSRVLCTRAPRAIFTRA